MKPNLQKLPPILFEDEAVIAFDKPSGWLVAPDRWEPGRENLMQMVHEKMLPTIFNVHRLDGETSGVLLCAKTKEALDRLSGQFQARKVVKRYRVITRGSPPTQEIIVREPIGEDERRPGRMRVAKSGKPAETRVVLLKRWRGFSCLEAFPLTGRTHQIRVHLAFIGCPVLADSLYGDGQGLMLSEIKRAYRAKEDEPERPLLGRLGLHAESITFRHPTTNRETTIESPLPKLFNVAIKYLSRFAG